MPKYCNHCRHSRAPGGACEFCGAPPPMPPPSRIGIIAHARQDANLLRRGACMPYAAANTIERLCDRVEALEARDVDADCLAFRTWYINDNGTQCYHPEDLENAAAAWHAALAWARGDKGGV